MYVPDSNPLHRVTRALSEMLHLPQGHWTDQTIHTNVVQVWAPIFGVRTYRFSSCALECVCVCTRACMRSSVIGVTSHCFTFRVQGLRNTGDISMTATGRWSACTALEQCHFTTVSRKQSDPSTTPDVAISLRSSAANVAVTDLCLKGTFHVRNDVSISCRDVSLSPY
jgi:hypothetical protein